MSTTHDRSPETYVNDSGFADGFNVAFLTTSPPAVMLPERIPAEFDNERNRQRYIDAWQQGFLYALKIKGARRGYAI